ncbi:phage major capsid protein, partial [Citrobacter sp. TBCS-11]
DGFAKKVARGIDLMAFHGVNPRLGTASAVIGTNHFDSKVSQKVEAPRGLADPNGAIENAVELLTGVDADVTGIAINPSFRSALAKQKDLQGN